MEEKAKQQRDRGVLILVTGLMLMPALCVAFYLAIAWVDDGDGTCGPLYQPDIWRGRVGCSSRMMWRGFAAYMVIVAALWFPVVAWRRSRGQETADLRSLRLTLRSPALLVTVGLTLGLGWLLVYNPIPGRDVARHRSTYGAFPVFPGARKISERSFQITVDGAGTGHYGLTVRYGLPGSATAREVFTFLRGSAPSGWAEATDEACARWVPPTGPVPERSLQDSSNTVVAPPPPATPIDRLELVRREDELTMLQTRGIDMSSLVDGITFRLFETRQEQVLELNQATISCSSG